MLKLLILAYDFPPYVSVGGLRPYSWYKYLHQFDVYPVVITRQWNNRHGNHLDYIAPGESSETIAEESEIGTLIRTAYVPNLANRLLLKYGDSKYKLLRKSISAFYELGQFLLPIGPKANLYHAADEYLKNNKVDCIIATGDPYILFKYASKLGRKYSVPWIADYRDPWIQDKSLKNSRLKNWFAFLERKILADAYKVTTVQPFFKQQIEQNVVNKDFGIIYNGYDPDVIELTKNITQNKDVLSIAFAGTIKDEDPVASFLGSCHEIIEENPDFKLELNFYGINRERDIKEMVANQYWLLKNCTNIFPRMNNLELVKVMAEKNVLLLFNYHSILGTKIFDYLALKRKIILCYDEGTVTDQCARPQAELINATNSGIAINDAEHLKRILQELSDVLKENGYISCPSTGIDKYSRVRQVERLAEIVKGVAVN